MSVARLIRMPSAIDPEAAVAIDPTALALLSIFGGVILTVIAGFIGAWIQGRREHAKWLRDQRMAAFIAARQTATEAFGFWREMRRILNEETTGPRLAPSTPRAQQEWDDGQAERTGEIAEYLERIKVANIRGRENLAALEILGPRDVADVVNAIVVADADTAQEDWEKAIELMEERMRSALGVKD